MISCRSAESLAKHVTLSHKRYETLKRKWKRRDEEKQKEIEAKKFKEEKKEEIEEIDEKPDEKSLWHEI